MKIAKKILEASFDKNAGDPDAIEMMVEIPLIDDKQLSTPLSDEKRLKGAPVFGESGKKHTYVIVWQSKISRRFVADSYMDSNDHSDSSWKTHDEMLKAMEKAKLKYLFTI